MTDNTPKNPAKPPYDGMTRLAVQTMTMQLNKDRMRAEVTSGLANISNDNKERAERITAALRLAGYIDENVSKMPATMIESFFTTMENLDDDLVKQGVADLFKERIRNINNVYPDAFVAHYFNFVRKSCDDNTKERVLMGMGRMLKKYRQHCFGSETIDVIKGWADVETNLKTEMALDALLVAHEVNRRQKKNMMNGAAGINFVGTTSTS